MPQGINTARTKSISFFLPRQHFCLGAMPPDILSGTGKDSG
jgi:hypothetical protein